MNRELTYSEAIREATTQLMKRYPEVYVMGEGADDYKGLWGTTKGLIKEFGEERVLDIPIAENGMTGIAIGSALLGFRPIFTHQRIDFMLMCFDAIFNHAAKWFNMTGLQKKVPLTVRAIIGRGWGQSVQHAQCFYPAFTHFPGVKVIVPYTPYEAKGLLTAAVLDDDPVIIIEARRLYDKKGPVPQKLYKSEIGKGNIIKKGKDLTIVSLSYMLDDVLIVAQQLETQGLSAEVINMCSIKPLDIKLVLNSVKKTRNLVVVDLTWEYFNLASELSSRVAANLFKSLERPPLTMALPDSYVGASEYLEKQYYLSPEKILAKIMRWHKNKN